MLKFLSYISISAVIHLQLKEASSQDQNERAKEREKKRKEY
jgi:hypothetical protein